MGELVWLSLVLVVVLHGSASSGPGKRHFLNLLRPKSRLETACAIPLGAEIVRLSARRGGGDARVPVFLLVAVSTGEERVVPAPPEALGPERCWRRGSFHEGAARVGSLLLLLHVNQEARGGGVGVDSTTFLCGTTQIWWRLKTNRSQGLDQ